MLDDALNYLKLQGLEGRHCTSRLSSTPNGVQQSNASSPQEGQAVLQASGSNTKLFVFSAADQNGLTRLTALFAPHLSRRVSTLKSEKYFENLANTLGTRRSTLRWRTYAVASSLQELGDVLENCLAKAIRSADTRNLGFVFTGQGAQWHAMGSELKIFPAFRESLDNLEVILRELDCTWSLQGLSMSLLVVQFTDA